MREESGPLWVLESGVHKKVKGKCVGKKKGKKRYYSDS